MSEETMKRSALITLYVITAVLAIYAVVAAVLMVDAYKQGEAITLLWMLFLAFFAGTASIAGLWATQTLKKKLFPT